MKKIDFSIQDLIDPNSTATAEKRIIHETAEQIPLTNFYTVEDIKSAEHTSYNAGIAPYLRGP